MGNNLLDILLPPESFSPDRIFGVVVGIVTNNNDLEGLGRVRVRFPWLSGTDESADESAWARIAAPMAGKGRGAYFLPEVDDEVLVAFEHGDIRFPFVLGALWNGQDKPPAANNDGKNNLRLIQSRSGHKIRLDDTKHGEKIEIIDSSGKNSLVIETRRKEEKEDTNAITVKAEGDITLESTQGKVTIKGQGIEVQATAQDVKVNAAGKLDLSAGPELNIKGAIVNIN